VEAKKANVFTDDPCFDQSSSNYLIQETNVVTSTSTGFNWNLVYTLYICFLSSIL